MAANKAIVSILIVSFSIVDDSIETGGSRTNANIKNTMKGRMYDVWWKWEHIILIVYI